MRFRFTVLSVLSATLLAGCFGKVLDFQNARITGGKLYEKGANEPFSGKVTNLPFSMLPKAPVTTVIGMEKSDARKGRGLPTPPVTRVIDMAFDLNPDSGLIAFTAGLTGAPVFGTLSLLEEPICDAEFDKGVPDGKAVCMLSGLDEPFVTMRYEKGSVEGAVKVASPKAKGVTLAQATFKGNALEGELTVNHAETGKLVGRSHWRAGKLDGPKEDYSLTDCVDGWTAAFRKENGDDAMVTMDQLGEWEDWCRQGKAAR